MARRRRRSHAKENPEHTLLYVGLGALVVLGGVGLYLYSKSQSLSNPNNIYGAMGAGTSTSSTAPASSSSSGSSGSSAATPAASSNSTGS